MFLLGDSGIIIFPAQAAVFPPQFRNLADPQLELFDLDEAFSSEKSRLAQITNKCGEEDLEYYIRYYISTIVHLYKVQHYMYFCAKPEAQFRCLRYNQEMENAPISRRPGTGTHDLRAFSFS